MDQKDTLMSDNKFRARITSSSFNLKAMDLTGKCAMSLLAHEVRILHMLSEIWLARTLISHFHRTVSHAP